VLFSFARNTNISVRFALEVEGPNDLFHLPLSGIALHQLKDLAHELASIQESSDPNIWSYIWGSPYFSSSKAYKHLIGHRVTHAAFKWLWKSACQNKHKVFFWLLLNDRLSTRELLRRRNMCYGPRPPNHNNKNIWVIWVQFWRRIGEIG